MTVITEESPGRQRIPDACNAVGIPYIGLADLIEQENWQFGQTSFYGQRHRHFPESERRSV